MGSWPAIRLLLLRTHFLAGVFVAPLLIVIFVSGVLCAFAPQVENLVYHRELVVDNTGGVARPLAEQLAAARQAHPTGAPATVRTPDAPDGTTAFVFRVDDRVADIVYVDPYTAQVRGELATVDGRTPLEQWLRDLHGSLHLGTVGRVLVEAASLWLVVLLGGGLALWLARRRRERRATGGRSRLRGWHCKVGVAVSLGLLALVVTGVIRSPFTGARTAGLLAEHPPVPPVAASGPPAVTLDQAVAAAGLTGPLTIDLPADDRPYVITERTHTWPVRTDRAVVHPASGDLLAVDRRADLPPATALATLGVLAHSGALFGLANQIVAAALMVGTLCVIVWGYRMWWRRGARRGAPVRRGVLRAMPPRPRLITVAVTAAVCVALPAFGLSLLAFLIIDSAVERARHRAQPPDLARQTEKERKSDARTNARLHSGRCADSRGPGGVGGGQRPARGAGVRHTGGLQVRPARQHLRGGPEDPA
ncbi:Uncharacterized iron-regulated membrane protein [Actinokineospora iranica]|uniref:Uncharacterized iron-regulated membrane protein n=2 Tax=Actinokineospora iranica TaxID=1271860 RepID=A0A1G6JNC5_9PSEU|nr:Uncharacterized iron-regulated membrane protein [Actinokineospora iranica]